MPIKTTKPTRVLSYRCHECREDAEFVLTKRAHPNVIELYHEHVRECSDCRRFDRRLRSVYSEPPLPPTASQSQQSADFSSIIGRVQHQRRMPTGPARHFVPAGVAAICTAAALTIALITAGEPGLHRPAYEPAAVTRLASADVIPRNVDKGAKLEHPSQTYGRIVAGRGSVQRQTGDKVNGNSFKPGAHVKALNEPLHVSLAGKLLATFQPGADTHWDGASPERLDLAVDDGLIAVRYDRLEEDPTLFVNTPSAIVRVVGTVFTVEVEESPTGGEPNTIVSVLRGRVDVLDSETKRRLAVVDAGQRFDVATSTWFDVGREEVEAAIPLSNNSKDASAIAGHVPTTWVVPGLPADERLRSIESVLGPFIEDEDASHEEIRVRRRRHAHAHAQSATDEDEDAILRELVARAQRDTQLAEIHEALEQCRSLYDTASTRFKALDCLTKFATRFGNDPAAYEGLLMIGILRMDFAHDYQAATLAFEDFLRRAPNHKLTELATYKLWLATTENGQVGKAERRGREYLERYPNGRYVGRILGRFPELKEAL